MTWKLQEGMMKAMIAELTEKINSMNEHHEKKFEKLESQILKLTNGIQDIKLEANEIESQLSRRS